MLKLVLLLLTAFLSSSHQQCFSEKDFVGYHTTPEIYSWMKTRLNFGVSLLKFLNKQTEDQNLNFSPWSIQRALLLAYFGAKNETESAIANILQIPAKQTKPLSLWFYNMDADKENLVNNSPMKSAIKIFLSKKLTPRRCISDKFGKELKLIDFERDSGQWAKYYINSWVKSRTKGEIKDFFVYLPPSTSAALVSALYFKGYWQDKFDPTRTRYMTFYRSPTDTTSAEMMVKDTYFTHGNSNMLGGRMLLLPYVDNRTAMIVLLPHGGLSAMIESLNAITIGMVTDIKAYRLDYFEVAIPKFKHQSDISLRSTLSSLGIGKALTESADFSGFTGKREIFFEDYLHKAVIKVDEEGTAAPGINEPGTLSTSNPLDFHCDRPFAYLIYDFLASKILFMGTYRQP